ncbi:hypothetical protein PSH1140_167 [Enterobacter phage myPSH1140]|uniref:Uncharacterized protein n=1 Tax=Enterobacter phage myPSH1140 TaxID=2108137 RepID=A0A2R3ZXD1_9CAUD|nr:hypothetical protein KNT83_gp167 [Enterobacter phage myPSH1140]AVR55372.1 hypothetical protein PSH1140_167 [Enterobacter phage myPSH1140]
MDEFETEIQFLMKSRRVRRDDIRIIPDHPVGEDVLYIKGKFAGYLDVYFYEENMGIDMHMRQIGDNMEVYKQAYK